MEKRIVLKKKFKLIYCILIIFCVLKAKWSFEKKDELFAHTGVLFKRSLCFIGWVDGWDSQNFHRVSNRNSIKIRPHLALSLGQRIR